MDYMVKQTGSLNSVVEDLFVELFCDTFGPDKSQFRFIQYPSIDINGDRRFIDFSLENDSIPIAIEIDGETHHNPQKISNNKYFDGLLKQNRLTYDLKPASIYCEDNYTMFNATFSPTL